MAAVVGAALHRPDLLSFLIIKYGLLTATFAFLYLVGKRVFADRRWAAIAALSPLLLHAMGPDCHKCRVAIPYDRLAAALEARGFHSGTLIAEDRHDAGNLRRMFPEARIVSLGRPNYAPSLRAVDLSSKVAVVWRKPDESKLPAEAEPELVRIAGSATVTPERILVPWQPYPPTSAKRVWEWMVVVADPANR
jgi:hypothetical protein